jgi:hypothetical protein
VAGFFMRGRMAGMQAELVFCYELRLMLRVTVGGERHLVEYDGRPWGREKIFVDGDIAAWRFKLATMPVRLGFAIGDVQATFEGTFAMFAGKVLWDKCRLTINGELVFHEKMIDPELSDTAPEFFPAIH